MTNLPFSFGYTFFARVLLPGGAGSSALIFLLRPLVRRILPCMDTIQILATVTGLVLSVGMLVSLAHNHIYQLYQGVLCPRTLRGYARRRLERRVAKALEACKTLRQTDAEQYARLRNWLRDFPVSDDGTPSVTSPTELGNILASAWTYPFSRYGMSAYFYWYRIWLTVDEDTRTQVDNDAANLDAAVLTSCVCLLTSGVYLIAAGLLLTWQGSAVAAAAYLESPGALTAAAVVALACAYVTYRISLPLARSRTEYFKSLFDVFRCNIESITTEVSEPEKERWEKTWRRLQH